MRLFKKGRVLSLGRQTGLPTDQPMDQPTDQPMDQPTGQPTDRRTKPHIEMRGRILKKP